MSEKTKCYGGNIVQTLDIGLVGKHMFAEGPYTYFMYSASPNENVKITELNSFTVFILYKSPETSLLIKGAFPDLHVGDSIQVEGRNLELKVLFGIARLLIAGVQKDSSLSESVNITPLAKIYKVIKPWGHELWINGQNLSYVMKEIYIKKGTKISLQYHRQKKETNVLFSGNARLYYKADPKIFNDNLLSVNMGIIDMKPVTAIDISPMVVHRIEAQTDVLLYEVSTPHLDDVVRIQDDSGRPDGRIATEHQ